MGQLLVLWLTDECFIWLEDRMIGTTLDALVTSLRQRCLKPDAAKKLILTTQTKPASTFKTQIDAELEHLTLLFIRESP